MARRARAKLVLVYVEPLTSPSYWTPVIAPAAIEAGAAFVDEVRENAAQFLAPQGIHWEVVHHRGEPARGLEAVAEELRADCIVVGRSHAGGGLGSVAKTLINLATRAGCGYSAGGLRPGSSVRVPSATRFSTASGST